MQFLLLFAACSGTAADLGGVDGKRALEHVREIVRHGPHPPGSEAQFKVGNYIIETLRSFDLEVETYSFEPMTPHGPLRMRNIWGILPGKREDVILIASHYDSKFFREFEFVGANDGGASSAVVLELARLLSQTNPTDYTLWFVFFDGEEAIVEWTDQDSLYGSREFVRMLNRRNQLDRIRAMILLDLMGGELLQLRKDVFSTDWLKDLIWEKARRLGHNDIFLQSGTTAAQDDHIPFLEVGIPAADIIDLGYKYWHTAEDTIDKLSPRNMAIVGNVVLASLPEIAEHLTGSSEKR